MHKIKALQLQYEDKINHYLHYTTIVIFFFLPITRSFPDSYVISFLFFLIYILLILRGNYIHYFSLAFAHPLTKAFFYFFIIHIIWLFGSENIHEALHTWIKYEYYSLYPLLFFSFIDKRFCHYFLSAFLAGAFFSEVLSYLMQFHTIPMEYSIHIHIPFINHDTLHYFYRSARGGPTPFVEHSATSFMLAITASILLIKLFTDKKINYLYLFFFATISMNIFFIQARTGYILYFFLLGYIIIFLRKHHHLSSLYFPKKLLYFIPLLAIGISIFMYNQNGIFKQRLEITQKRITNVIQTGDLSAMPRLLLVKQALVTIEDNFPFGVGSGDALKTLQSYPENQNTEITSGFIQNVHNQYLDILLQFGIIGLLVYLYLLYKIFTYKHPNMSTQSYLIKQIVAISMLYIGFLATFWAYIPTIIVMLLIITTAENKILKRLPEIDKKTVFKLFLFILLSYTIGAIQ